MYLRRNLRTVWPPNASLYASSTCVHLRLLAGPFGQGLTYSDAVYFFSPSTTPQSAQCGISRIWVHSQYRRKKVATRLLDCVRWEARNYALIIRRDRRFFPFSRQGDRASERANERARGEQKNWEKWRGVSKKKREKGKGVRKEWFLPHRTRSQFRPQSRFQGLSSYRPRGFPACGKKHERPWERDCFVPFAYFWKWTAASQAMFEFSLIEHNMNTGPCPAGLEARYFICA